MTSTAPNSDSIETMRDDAAIYYVDSDTGLAFQWHGGAYIDVGCFPEDRNAYETSLESFKAYDVINVWDYEQDISTLELKANEAASGKDPYNYTARPFRRVLELFEQACRSYIAEQDDGEA